MSERPLEQTTRWRLLRRLLPAWYRDAFGAELLHLHAEQSANGPSAHFCWRLTCDVLVTALQVRIDGLRAAPAALRRVRAGWLDAIQQNVRLATRGVLHAPGFTAAVLITLTLGIGANLTLFSVLDRLLLSPPEHIRQPDQVRRISIFGISPLSRQEGYNAALSYPDYRDLANVRGFAGLAGYGARSLTLGRGEVSERIAVELATASYFPLLDVQPALGRFYTESEDRIEAATPAVILSYGFWQRRFGGERTVLGKTVDLGRGRYTIVGVAPRGFTGIDVAPVDAWVPLHTTGAIESGKDWVEGRRWYWFGAVARLDGRVSDEAALGEATARYRAGRAEAEGKPSSSRVVAHPLIAARGPHPSAESRVTRALTAVALMMLLIACANAGNLFLVRGVQRRKLLAVQSALGVGRARMIAQLVTEAFLLAAMAGGIGYILSRTAGPLLFRTLLPEATPPTTGGWRVLAVTFLLTIVTTVAAGVVPALRSSRIDLMEVLRAARGRPRASWLRRALLGVQAALSVILVIGAGLFVRSLQQARSLDFGLDLNTVGITLELSNGRRSGSELAEAVKPGLERLRAHPGVASVATTSHLPFSGLLGLAVDLPGPDSIVSSLTGPFYYGASVDYFRTLGIPVLRGRPFTDADLAVNGPLVALANQTMARAVWGEKDPIGQCLIVGRSQQCTIVIGVVGDVLPAVTSGQAHQLFYLPPNHPGGDGVQTLIVRTRGNPEDVLPVLRQVVRSASPNIRFVDAATLRERIAPDLRSWQLGATLLTVFGLLALMVAAAGLYSVLAFDVAQRRFELGVRAALGASAPRLVRSIVADALVVAAFGVLAGLAGALTLARLGESLLFRVQPTDPLVYGAAMAALFTIAAVASALPAWRATRADPKIALQSE